MKMLRGRAVRDLFFRNIVRDHRQHHHQLSPIRTAVNGHEKLAERSIDCFRQGCADRRGYSTRGCAHRGRTGALESLEIVSSDEASTSLLAKLISRVSEPRSGDVMFLKGPVGSGKSVFCRSFVRDVLRNSEEDVPSPTYLLQQSYPCESGLVIQHLDLYRFDDSQLDVMLQRASFDQCLLKDCVVVEWADRLPGRYCGVDRLELTFSLRGDSNISNCEGRDRGIQLTAKGAQWGSVLESLHNVLISTSDSNANDSAGSEPPRLRVLGSSNK
mmetsp:Transcript_5265/g.13753  ORF Transcript_5265/g.13753 Transcript_5265/m.13753 type:complete len:272 (-) Transcript_5265:119-934(-)